jgi:hypothetical protein
MMVRMLAVVVKYKRFLMFRKDFDYDNDSGGSNDGVGI